MKLFRAAAVIPAAALVLAAAVPASAAASPHHAGSCRAQGDFAICTAGGNAWHPSSIHIHVSASPGQKVTGAWDVVCGKGDGAGSRSGNFSGRTTLNRKISHPYSQPDSCTVAADAQLSGSGRWIHVWITYWRWRA